MFNDCQLIKSSHSNIMEFSRARNETDAFVDTRREIKPMSLVPAWVSSQLFHTVSFAVSCVHMWMFCLKINSIIWASERINITNDSFRVTLSSRNINQLELSSLCARIQVHSYKGRLLTCDHQALFRFRHSFRKYLRKTFRVLNNWKNLRLKPRQPVKNETRTPQGFERPPIVKIIRWQSALPPSKKSSPTEY